MKYKYDAETDILVIKLSGRKPDFAEQEGDLITHYDRENKPVEIEILNASETALQMVRAMIPHKKVAAVA
ncbi:MAG: DUF2283 domain-containing protein [Candidatus Diapherotrites archaeon]|nr:DUF2283 domain-containing protein [Candidatus Diapherotrites archaeon]